MEVTLFDPRGLDDLLGGERRVAAKFGASWCGMCGDLERAVLHAGPGRALFGDLETCAIDFDEAPELAERFAILELPTVLVVRPDGVEVARIVGFRDAKSWIAEARVAVQAEDPMPALWAEAVTGGAYAQLALGEALLSRSPDEGIPLLERVSWTDGKEASRALWVLGRFHHRVRKDPGAARFIWQQLALRWPLGRHDGWWWYANAQAELGQVELGSRAFEAWVEREPGHLPALTDWTRFCGRQGYEPARAKIRAAALAALERAKGRERDALEELVMSLGRPFS